MKTCKTVDEYMKDVPSSFLPKAKEMRSLIRKLVPKGEEAIRYGIPTIQLNGKNFVHFAAMKGHLGFYPTSSGVKAFESELDKRGISFSKGCIRLPYAKPLPVSLISRIIRFRLQEERAAIKGKEKAGRT